MESLSSSSCTPILTQRVPVSQTVPVPQTNGWKMVQTGSSCGMIILSIVLIGLILWFIFYPRLYGGAVNDRPSSSTLEMRNDINKFSPLKKCMPQKKQDNAGPAPYTFLTEDRFISENSANHWTL